MLMSMLLLLQRVRRTFNKTQWAPYPVISSHWKLKSRVSLHLLSTQKTL